MAVVVFIGILIIEGIFKIKKIRNRLNNAIRKKYSLTIL